MKCIHNKGFISLLLLIVLMNALFMIFFCNFISNIYLSKRNLLSEDEDLLADWEVVGPLQIRGESHGFALADNNEWLIMYGNVIIQKINILENKTVKELKELIADKLECEKMMICLTNDEGTILPTEQKLSELSVSNHKIRVVIDEFNDYANWKDLTFPALLQQIIKDEKLSIQKNKFPAVAGVELGRWLSLKDEVCHQLKQKYPETDPRTTAFMDIISNIIVRNIGSVNSKELTYMHHTKIRDILNSQLPDE